MSRKANKWLENEMSGTELGFEEYGRVDDVFS